MSTCGRPVTVEVCGCLLSEPCDKSPGHDELCSAWFQFGPPIGPKYWNHEPNARAITFDTVPCEAGR